MSIAIQRIKRAIQDMPTGGMQTGKKQIKLEYSDAQRAITEIEALQAELDALAAQVARLENELRQQKLIHVGFTNQNQLSYVVEQKIEGCFYPDTDNECYIPLYMLDIHAHRAGPDSEIYKEHCELWKHKKNLAEIRDEAGRAGFVAGYAQHESDADCGIRFRAEKMSSEYAAQIRQGGKK